MPSRLPEPQAKPRSGPASTLAVDELTRVLFAPGGLVWLGGRSILFLVLLLGWLVVR